MAEGSPPQLNDLSAGRSAGSLQRRCGGSPVSGGPGLALLCAPAKRLLSEVFVYCSAVSRGLSPSERAIIREVNETFSCEKGGALHVVHRPGITCTSSSPLRDLRLQTTNQVLLSLARQLFGDCSRAVPLEVMRCLLMILIWDR